MKEQLEKRLQVLTAEYEAGQKALANLEAQKTSLRETLIRISGAIQVLEEELAIANRENNHKPRQIDTSTLEVIAKN
jgi:predicted nuclease with TOPRIM domain